MLLTLDIYIGKYDTSYRVWKNLRRNLRYICFRQMYKFKGHVEPYVQASRQHSTRMNIAFLRQLYEMGKYDVPMNYRKFLEEFGEQGICC